MEQIVYRQQLEGVIMVEQVTREENYSMPYRHFHDTFELYYLTEGESYYFIDRETYLVKAGDMVLIKPDRVHKTSLAKLSRHSRILLQITEKAFAPFLNANGFPALDELYGRLGRIVSLREEDRERMKELMLCIGEEIRGRQKRYELMVKMKLLEILLLLSRYQGDGLPEEEGRTAQTPRYQKVQEVVDYLHANPGTGESLEELAGRFYISRSWLSRIFREVTGISVVEYTNIMRVRNARKLLAFGEYSVTEISERLGFESITYFERVFKKYTDCTPLKYRKEQRKG